MPYDIETKQAFYRKHCGWCESLYPRIAAKLEMAAQQEQPTAQQAAQMRRAYDGLATAFDALQRIIDLGNV